MPAEQQIRDLSQPSRDIAARVHGEDDVGPTESHWICLATGFRFSFVDFETSLASTILRSACLSSSQTSNFRKALRS
jgi:hypothetical protein